MRYYYVVSNIESKENYYQLEELTDKLVQFNQCVHSRYPKVIPLMASSERLKCRKIPFVLQFHVPDREIYPEEYAHHLLFMHLPFRDKNEIK